MKFLKIVGAVALINITARLLGFIREIVIGYQFGTTYLADSIITAFTIPNFIYLVVGGAITTAFISIFSKLDDEKRRKRFVSSILFFLIVVLGSTTTIMMIFSESIIGFVFSGLAGEELQQTAQLFFWMAPSSLFLVLAVWLSGVLNVHERFKTSSFSTLLFNLAFVGLAILLVPFIGISAYAVGAVTGSVFMLALLVYSINKYKYVSFTLKFDYNDDFKRLLKLSLPIMLGGATLQFYFLIQRIFASSLSDGYIAALNYSSKLTQFPQAVLMTAVTTVIYPMLAKKTAAEDVNGISQLYQKGIRWLFLLLVPASLYVYFYAKPIISVIFEYGSFTAESSAMTVPLLQIFAFSMFALAANVYITRFFYAAENSYLPVIISIFSVFGVNVGAILLLMDRLEAEAVAWGTTISSFVNFMLLIVVAKKVLKLSFEHGWQNLIDFALLTTTVATALYLSSEFISFPFHIVELVVGLIILVAAILITMSLRRFNEMEMLLAKLRKK